MTIHAAKGLEFPAVIVSALDLLPSPIEPDEVRDSNLLYVGLTRAMDHLVVTWTGRSEFTDRVPRSNRSEAIPSS
jgi:superfamily I DNA/RNA helicase